MLDHRDSFGGTDGHGNGLFVGVVVKHIVLLSVDQVEAVGHIVTAGAEIGRGVEIQGFGAQRRDVDREGFSDGRHAFNRVRGFDRGHGGGAEVEHLDAQCGLAAADEVGKRDRGNAEVEVFEREDHDVVEEPVVDVVTASVEEDAELHVGLTHVRGVDFLAHRP